MDSTTIMLGLDENEQDINAALQQLEDTFDTRSEASDTSEKGATKSSSEKRKNKGNHNNDSSMSSVSSGGSSPKAKRQRHKSSSESKGNGDIGNSKKRSESPEAKKQSAERGSASKSSYDYMTKLTYLFRDARFFVIKSNNADNVTLSKTKNVWATLPQNEANLNRAFKECRNVLLIFSVKESGKFAGFARMSCESKRSGQNVDWVLPPGISAKALGGVFEIDWVCKKELSFTCTTHLYNPWNEGKPVKIGRDGQEIEPKVAQELCKLFPEDDAIELLPILKKAKESGRILREKGIKPNVNRRPPMSSSRSNSSRGGRDARSMMMMRGRRKFIPGGKRSLNGPPGGPPFKKPMMHPYSRDGRLPGKLPRYPSTTAAAEAYVADYMRQMQHHQLPPMPYAPPPGFPQLLDALPPPLPRYYDGSLSSDYHSSTMPGAVRPPPPPAFFSSKSSADHRSDRSQHHRNNDYNNRSDKERNNDRIPGQKRKIDRNSGNDWNHRGSDRGDNKSRNFRGRR
ncbi:YTH domain-containing protein 1 [Culicoides brevitarsis]|uniref:YTH domain-containing protein 1 n=1 Tax=Culicoides brevitarsis TaxID=469753 RepID=UPI00307C24CA